MEDSEKLQDLRAKIKELEQKKTTLTDAAEIKAINKEISELQMKYGRLRQELKDRRDYERSVEREFVHSMIGDD